MGDASETALWIQKLGESAIYVGTTKDIYRLDGDFTTLPDGAINVVKRPMHVSEPPVSSAVEVGFVNGTETLVYLSGDGWRVLGGGSLVSNAVDLLWRGQERHGVPAVNLSASSRFRCAIAKNVFYALTPEYGTDETSSAVIHAYAFGKQRWYRYIYPQAFRSLYAEYDGTLIAGDHAGYVRILELPPILVDGVPAKLDDGAAIPVAVWTSVDDNGQPFTFKDSKNAWLRVDTHRDSASLRFFINGNDFASLSTSIGLTIAETANIDTSAMEDFSQVQLRISGTFSTFVLRAWGLSYLDNPMPMLVHDTGPVDISGDQLKWISLIRVKAKATADITVTPYFDGQPGTVATLPVGAAGGAASIFEMQMGREDRAKTARVVITSPRSFHVYWVEFNYNGTGSQTQKRVKLVPEVAT
jgi:hypothetical protein